MKPETQVGVDRWATQGDASETGFALQQHICGACSFPSARRSPPKSARLGCEAGGRKLLRSRPRAGLQYYRQGPPFCPPSQLHPQRPPECAPWWRRKETEQGRMHLTP